MELLLLFYYFMHGIYAVTYETSNVLPNDNNENVGVDTGYGSRVQTGHNLAQGTILRKLIYGSGGPGRRRRRSSFHKDWSNTEGFSPSGDYRLLNEVQDLRELHPDTANPDSQDFCCVTLPQIGYNSYESNSEKEKLALQLLRKLMLANTEDLLNPMEDSKNSAMELMSSSGTYNDHLENTHGNNNAHVILNRRGITDSGYGTRVNLYSNIANHTSSLDKIDEIFGIHGPGRR